MRRKLVARFDGGVVGLQDDVQFSADAEFAVRLVDQKLLTKHRVLPMMARGKRLFVALADPTNLHKIYYPKQR